MTERSKQIFGNDIAPGAYKKQSGQSRNLSVNSGMTAQKLSNFDQGKPVYRAGTWCL